MSASHKLETPPAWRDEQYNAGPRRTQTAPCFDSATGHLPGYCMMKVLHKTFNCMVALYRKTQEHPGGDPMALEEKAEVRNGKVRDTGDRHVPAPEVSLDDGIIVSRDCERCTYSAPHLKNPRLLDDAPDLPMSAFPTPSVLTASKNVTLKAISEEPSPGFDVLMNNRIRDTKSTDVDDSDACAEEVGSTDTGGGQYVDCPSLTQNDSSNDCSGDAEYQLFPYPAPLVVKTIDKMKCSHLQIERVRHEAELLSTLNHKHIVKLLSFFEDDKQLALGFEFAAYGDLHSASVHRTLPERHVQKYMRQLLDALYYVHRCGVVHGDVKPHNLLIFGPHRRSSLTTTGRRLSVLGESHSAPAPQHNWSEYNIKLGDFGLAQNLNGNQKVKFNCVLGTPNYIAPEVLWNLDYDCKVDIWAVGVITFQLLVGYEPFYPPSSSRSERLQFSERDWSGISLGAQDFVRLCLVREAENRLSAAEALSHPWMSPDAV